MKTRILVMGLALAALAGCETQTTYPISEEMFISEPAPISTAPLGGPAAQDPGGIDPALALVEEDPYDQTIESGASGLTERLPDTCKLENFQQYRGLTKPQIDASGLSVPYRVVGQTDIVTQEYNPMRVNFYTDASGVVVQISCG